MHYISEGEKTLTWLLPYLSVLFQWHCLGSGVHLWDWAVVFQTGQQEAIFLQKKISHEESALDTP